MEWVNTTLAEISTPKFGVFSLAILNHSDRPFTLLVPQYLKSICYERKGEWGRKDERNRSNGWHLFIVWFKGKWEGRKEVETRNLHLGPKLFHPLNYEKIMEGKQQRVRTVMCFHNFTRGEMCFNNFVPLPSFLFSILSSYTSNYSTLTTKWILSVVSFFTAPLFDAMTNLKILQSIIENTNCNNYN